MVDVKEKGERILWIDIYKALAITLVVIGHSTGLFNRYIYQFHLAAFFFISGYVAKLDYDSWGKHLFKKLYTLILPVFTWTIIGGLVMDILYKEDIYQLIFGEMEYVGFSEILIRFLSEGSLYVWVLGAAWFVITLFFVSLLAKLLWEISCKSIWIFLGYTTMVYIVGYMVIDKGILNIYHINLALIAQFFYSIGFVFRKQGGKMLSGMKIAPLLAGTIMASLIIGYCSRLSKVTIDYISGEFHNIFLNTFTSLVGIIWIFCLASLLGKIKCEWFSHIIVTIGQNTMGVVLLHFTIFKMVAAILYAVGIAELGEIAGITPSVAIGEHFWWLYVLLSEIICVLLWMFCKKIPLFNIMMGTNKNVIYKINDICDNPLNKKHRNKKENVGKNRRTAAIIVLAGGYMVLLGNFVMQQYRLHQALDITFPVDLPEKIIEFTDGWQPQSNEDYRWITDKGRIIINHKRHSKLMVCGYVPENFTEVTQLDIYVNETHLATIDVSTNRGFEETWDIADFINKETYSITFDFDGVHKPEAGNTDIRELSGMFTRIYIE